LGFSALSYILSNSFCIYSFFQRQLESKNSSIVSSRSSNSPICYPAASKSNPSSLKADLLVLLLLLFLVPGLYAVSLDDEADGRLDPFGGELGFGYTTGALRG